MPELPKLDEEVFEAFVSLSCRLSPENLYMDGEASDAEVKHELRAINKEWKALEQKAGCTVTEKDIWQLENQRWKEHGPRKRRGY